MIIETYKIDHINRSLLIEQMTKLPEQKEWTAWTDDGRTKHSNIETGTSEFRNKINVRNEINELNKFR